MSEEAKAVQEIAKTTGKFVELFEKVGAFMSKVIGGASEQVGGILEDWTRYYRYKNLLTIRDKVDALHHRRRIEGKTIPIPLRAAIPMLEAASLEQDTTLQDVWARLIANSMDPNFSEALHPSYIEIIKQMSSDEALILNAFREIDGYPTLFTHHVEQMSGWLAEFTAQPTYEGIYSDYLSWCKTLPLKHPDGARTFLDNLQRLQLIELGFDLSHRAEDNFFEHLKDIGLSDRLLVTLERNEYLRMTAFGEGFVNACIGEAT
ncbi:MAG: DUF4393 domain-containing protein [Thermodesulfobacteriota bacterium]|jgi:hypothetical protein